MGFLDPLRAENNHGRIGWGEHSVRAVPAFHEARPESSPYQPGGDSIAGTAMTSLVTAIPSIPWSTPAQPRHFPPPKRFRETAQCQIPRPFTQRQREVAGGKEMRMLSRKCRKIIQAFPEGQRAGPPVFVRFGSRAAYSCHGRRMRGEKRTDPRRRPEHAGAECRGRARFRACHRMAFPL